jgi:hypothetical protein
MADTLFGVHVPSGSEQMAIKSALRFSVSVDNPAKVKALEKSFAKFDEYYKKLYKDLVGVSHRYLIRITPLHTGKLRGGWTAFLDKYQIDYSKELYDTSLYSTWKKANKTEEYRNYAIDSSKVEEGKAFSHLDDAMPGDTVVGIENMVPYKDDMDFGTSVVPGRHFTDIALYKAEHWFDKYFSQWLASMERAGAVVPPPTVGDIPN